MPPKSTMELEELLRPSTVEVGQADVNAGEVQGEELEQENIATTVDRISENPSPADHDVAMHATEITEQEHLDQSVSSDHGDIESAENNSTDESYNDEAANSNDTIVNVGLLTKRGDSSPETDREYLCVYCNEKYTQPPTEDWLECPICKEWYHEACGDPESSSGICDICKQQTDLLYTNWYKILHGWFYFFHIEVSRWT